MLLGPDSSSGVGACCARVPGSELENFFRSDKMILVPQNQKCVGFSVIWTTEHDRGCAARGLVRETRVEIEDVYGCAPLPSSVYPSRIKKALAPVLESGPATCGLPALNWRIFL